MKNNLLKGYTLLEVMLSVAIFAIMGSLLYSNAPSVGIAIAFNTEANLITDVVRDIQIKGSSGYVGTSTDNINYSGLGLLFSSDMYDSTTTAKIKIFADKNDGSISDRGILRGNKYYDSNDAIISATSSGNQLNIVLKESIITGIYFGASGNKLSSITVSSPPTNVASVVFEKGDTKANITDLRVTPIKSTTTSLYIELQSKKLDVPISKCIIIMYSGAARVENDICSKFV